MKTKVYVNYKEETRTINSNFNGKNYTGSYHYETTSTILGVSKENSGSPYFHLLPINDLEDGEEIPENIFIVVVIYSTGNSFGVESGCLAIEGLYKDKETAKEIALSIKEDRYLTSKNNYAPWKGYFEYVEKVYVQLEAISGTPKIIEI